MIRHPASPSMPVQNREWVLLLVLAAVQFTHIMDFVIMMPLGPQFMRAFGISTREFGLMISAYTFSAALFGFMGALFIDRFDRRTSLLTLYFGFAVGTLFCALAPNHQFFIAARILAGSFAGVMGATVFAIIGDAFPESRRGAATGVIMSSFSLASIAGVPFGLYLATRLSWHAPFVMLVGIAALVWLVGFFALPSFRSHLAAEGSAKKNAAKDLWGVLREPNHIRSFVFTTMLMMGAFTVIPYLSAYMVNTAGYPEDKLPYIYLTGGAFTLFSSRWVGRLSDRHGKLKIFTIFAILSVVPLILMTHVTSVSVVSALLISTAMMVTMNGRMVPSMAMITSAVEPRRRGSFMSVNSSIQQLASGLASFIAGLMIVQGPLGPSGAPSLLNYDRVGYLAVACTVFSIFLARRLQKSG